MVRLGLVILQLVWACFALAIGIQDDVRSRRWFNVIWVIMHSLWIGSLMALVSFMKKGGVL